MDSCRPSAPSLAFVPLQAISPVPTTLPFHILFFGPYLDQVDLVLPREGSVHLSFHLLPGVAEWPGMPAIPHGIQTEVLPSWKGQKVWGTLGTSAESRPGRTSPRTRPGGSPPARPLRVGSWAMSILSLLLLPSFFSQSPGVKAPVPIAALTPPGIHSSAAYHGRHMFTQSHPRRRPGRDNHCRGP